MAFSGGDLFVDGTTMGRATAGRGGLAPTPPAKPLEPNTLTAGSFNDNQFWPDYTKFLTDYAPKASNKDFVQQFAAHRVLVQLVDTNNKPIPDAVVTLADSDPPVTMKTRADGMAVFLEKWDHLTVGPTATLSIKTPSSPAIKVKAQIDTPKPALITLDSTYDGGVKPRKLDLLFVVDCTGSMADELEYLKVEVKSIAQGIKEQFPLVDQRYGLICYRDQGDEFVVRKFDFTAKIDEFQANLAQQRATGGGDYPEAVDEALAAAANLDWTPDQAARVTFLIGDAPPHWPKMEPAMQAVNVLRSKGVGLYPVGCSGLQDDCEFIMRTFAVSTASWYLFATDHSGVGNAHAEPHFPFYNVEKLAPLMKRLIAGELSGHAIDPKPEEIIATVKKETPATVPAETNATGLP